MDIITSKPPIDQVSITIDGETTACSDPDEFAAILDDLKDRESEVKSAQIALIGLLDWSPKFFLLVVRFVDNVPQEICFQVGENAVTKSLFEAMLKVDVKAGDLIQFADLKRKILLVVSEIHPDVIGPCCQKIKDRFDQIGFKGDTVSSLAKHVRELSKTLSNDQHFDEVTIRVLDAVDGAPVDDRATVPSSFRLSASGIAEETDEDDPDFIASPIVIISRRIDVNTRQERIEIGWLRDGAWKRQIVPRRTIADSREILSLSNFGLPVNSDNSSRTIRYLARYEAENIAWLPMISVTDRLGYHNSADGPVFVLPTENIGSSKASSAIEFFSADEGLSQIASGYFSKGELMDWETAINQLADYPKILLAVFGSLATALGALLEFPNLIIDYCGRTSGGKTIALRIGTSVWGNPDEKSRESALHTWSATKTFLERVAGFAKDIPLVIDDSKNAASAEHVSQLIYLIAQGHGRGRGTIHGVQPTVSFRTIALSSGERSLTSFTNDGGTRARTLPIWHSPFEEFSPEKGSLASEMNEIVTSNFGLAGPIFVKFLLDRQDQWPDWQKEFDDERDKYDAWANQASNQFAARMAPSLAAITMAHWLAHQCFEFEFDYFDLIEPLWDGICKESAEADQARAALEYIYQWSVSHQADFYRGGDEKNTPFNGFVGRWDVQSSSAYLPTAADDEPEANSDDLESSSVELESSFDEPDEWESEDEDDAGDGNENNDFDSTLASNGVVVSDSWPWIGFIPARLKETLKEAGYDADAVIRQWHENGWLSTTDSLRRTRKARIGRELSSVWIIAVTHVAFDEVCGGI